MAESVQVQVRVRVADGVLVVLEGGRGQRGREAAAAAETKQTDASGRSRETDEGTSLPVGRVWGG